MAALSYSQFALEGSVKQRGHQDCKVSGSGFLRGAESGSGRECYANPLLVFSTWEREAIAEK